MSRPWTRWAADLAILWVLGSLAYLNSFGGAFQFDDIRCIVANQALRIPGLAEAWPALWRFSPGRVLAFATFWGNYQLGGLSVFGWHLANLLLHLLNGGLFYLLLRRVGPSLRKGTELPEWLPFLGAALFLLHPVQTQAVTYIVQRLELLGTLFLLLHLLSLWELWQGRGAERIFWGLLALLSLGLGLFCKETVAVAPLVGAAGYWLLKEPGPGRRKIGWPALLAGLALFLVLAAGVLHFAGILTFAGGLRWNSAPLARLYEDAPPPMRYFATQCKVWAVYLRLTVWPAALRVEYDYPAATDFRDLWVWLSLGLYALLFSLAFYLRRSRPALLLGLLLFALVLAPSSTVIPNGLYEHRLYGALPGIVIALLYGCLGRGRAVCLGLGLAVFLCGLLTMQRNPVWHSPESLWGDAVQKSPASWLCQANYGQALMEREAYAEALPYLQEAVRLRPRGIESRYNLACCLAGLGDLEGALRELKTALERQGRLPEVRRMVEEAAAQIEAALKARQAPAGD